jgi:hydrogenase-4 component F
MIVFFLAGASIISLLLFINKNQFINYFLIGIFLFLLFFFGIAEFRAMKMGMTGLFKPDALGILLLISLCIIALPVFFHGYRYIELHNVDETPRTRGLFFAAMVMLVSACSITYLSNHIAVTWIFVEVTTISASVLIYHHRNIRALEGVWKYVFICAISITFVYIGILFLSLSLKPAGNTDMSFDSLYKHADRMDLFWLKWAFLFIFTGFTVKLGLIPMYTAGIDAKDKAPAPAGALFASILMNVGFVSVYRIYALIAHTPLKNWANHVILITAIFSVFIAAVYMSRIKNIKRMFAYSGIEHMGLAMLGIAVGGIGVYAAILHILLHTLVKPCLFLQYNQIYWVYQSKSIYDTGNYFKYNKVGAILLILGFVSAVGMPPSGLFVSEFMIFQSLLEAHFIFVLLLILGFITLIIWGFGTNIFKLLFTPPLIINEARIPRISPWESLSQYILLALAIYMAYNPPIIMVNLIQDAVKIVV